MRFIFLTLLIVNVGFAVYLYRTLVSEPKVISPANSVSLPKALKSLVLLNEVEKKQVVETVRLRELANVVSRPPALLVEPLLGKSKVDGADGVVTDMCVRVGTFIGIADAKYFVEKLSEAGVQSTVKNVLVSTAVGFWLHLPPLPSSKELRRRLAELQRQGVDSYAIPDGDLANGISLGMFSEQQRAESLQKSISQLGYRPKIAEVPREKRELWVFLLKGEEQKVSDEMWFTWLSVNNLPKKQEILCSDVASA